MKIYTEVNYIWKDDKLVQTDSKSFDYDGEVTLCHSKRYPHNHALAKATGMTSETADKVNIPTVNEIKDTVSKGPTGGFPKKFADTLYGGSTKDAVTSIQETYKDFEGGVKSFMESELPSFVNPEVDDTEDGTILTTPEEREALLQQGLVAEGGRKKKYGRSAMSTGTEGSSILAP